ncbi:MAG: methyl-accepting chemotaxis protein, partial [Thermoanaerobacterium sp.]|nr:methyl-accepting chemotaxis protein [Thermoanaerobacterium sp.]
MRSVFWRLMLSFIVVALIPLAGTYHYVLDDKSAGVFIFVAAASFLLSVLFSIYISFTITKPIARLKEGFKKLSDGNFNANVSKGRNDEIGSLIESYNQMVDRVKGIIKNVTEFAKNAEATVSKFTESIDEANNTFSQIAKAVEEIAQGSSEQAKDASNAAEMAQKMGQNIDESANYFKAVEESTNNANRISQNGIETIKSLKDKTAETKNS